MVEQFSGQSSAAGGGIPRMSAGKNTKFTTQIKNFLEETSTSINIHKSNNNIEHYNYLILMYLGMAYYVYLIYQPYVICVLESHNNLLSIISIVVNSNIFLVDVDMSRQNINVTHHPQKKQRTTTN